MKKSNVAFKLNAETLFNFSFYTALCHKGGYNRYSTLFWSVFGPTDRYNFEGQNYRYAY